jgi:hypothetical protein
MQEQEWDDSIEDAKEFFEAGAILPDEDSEEKTPNPVSKSHITELRRRIEDRIESKRIAQEFDYDELGELGDFDDFNDFDDYDELTDSLQ